MTREQAIKQLESLRAHCDSMFDDRWSGDEVWNRDVSAIDIAIAAIAVIEDILGDEYDLDHLRELAQADREGRCVVLPCKPSNVTVYQLRSKKHARGRGVSPCHVGCAVVWAGGHYALEHQGDELCWDRDFGKTWFLTPEAAEKALEEMEENDYENGSI